MTADVCCLEAILAEPDNPEPRETYAALLRNRCCNACLRLAAAVVNFPADRGGHRYYDAGYLYGAFGRETDFRPGDRIPQAWPPIPFRKERRLTSPVENFFYCLALGQDEEAALWLDEVRKSE